jgi:hypothetical protein
MPVPTQVSLEIQYYTVASLGRLGGQIPSAKPQGIDEGRQSSSSPGDARESSSWKPWMSDSTLREWFLLASHHIDCNLLWEKMDDKIAGKRIYHHLT